jgi:hypothetical protein
VAGKAIAMGSNWGFPGCTPVSMDVDGDGRSELALYYPPTGTWYVRKLTGEIVLSGAIWGGPTWIPVKP